MKREKFHSVPGWVALLFLAVLSFGDARAASKMIDGVKPVVGEQSVLFIRLEFADKEYKLNDRDWRKRLEGAFDDFSEYYKKESYGKITEIGYEITPVIETKKVKDYLGIKGPGYDQFRQDAFKLLKAAGYRLDEYDLLVMSYPGGTGIEGNAGGLGLRTGGQGWIWLPQSSEAGVLEGLVHEGGHGFGIGHAGVWSPEEGTYDHSKFEDGSDPYAMMGSGPNSKVAPWNVVMKYLKGWFDDTNVEKIPRKTGTRTIRVYQSDHKELPQGKPIALTYKDGDRVLWFSYFGDSVGRQKEGLPKKTLGSGIFMHSAHGSERSGMYDFNPGSRAPESGRTHIPAYADAKDGTLVIGDTATIKTKPNPLTIKPLKKGKTDGFKWIEIEFTSGRIRVSPLDRFK